MDDKEWSQLTASKIHMNVNLMAMNKLEVAKAIFL